MKFVEKREEILNILNEALIVCLLTHIPNFKVLWCFKVIVTLTSFFYPEQVQYFSSLAQAVTSQAEHGEHLKGVFIMLITK